MHKRHINTFRFPPKVHTAFFHHPAGFQVSFIMPAPYTTHTAVFKRMAKQFLQNEMGKKAMCFKSPFPDENGIYHIFQSHRVEDEDSVEFPNERVFYRELGDGWALSVGY